MIRFIDGRQVREVTDYREVVECLRRAFQCEKYVTPLRQMHSINTEDGCENTFALMPAWRAGEIIGLKALTIFGGNHGRQLPTVQGLVLLFDGATGAPLAVIDGNEVTRIRTAAASALAADYMAKQSSSVLLIIGTGAQAPYMALAHSTIRPISKIFIWGRSRRKAEATAQAVRKARSNIIIEVASDLKRTVAHADIISLVTSSPKPLLFGEWIEPGTHIDAVGAYTSQMREVDDEVILRSRLFGDIKENVLAEAGDFVIPLDNGIISESDIVGDLYDLTQHVVEGRQSENDITLFKSVGAAMEDLAMAEFVYKMASCKQI